MATVSYPNGKVKTVRNLGWILRHWKDVESFTITDEGNARAWGCKLRANLKDGAVYETNFADRDVCYKFLHRPSFHGIRVEWFNLEFRIGIDTQK